MVEIPSLIDSIKASIDRIDPRGRDERFFRRKRSVRRLQNVLRMNVGRLLGCLLVSSLGACFLGGHGDGNGDNGNDAGDDGADIPPFQADSPYVYVAKVKDVLTGLPATDAEVQQVITSPSSFTALVDQWMQTPEYQSKMLEFFALAFQQTQISAQDFQFELPIGPGGIGHGPLVPLLVQNAQESFARTAYELVREGRPFTDVFTTTTFMATPPLLELYAFLDAWQTGNTTNQITDYFAKDPVNSGKSIVLESSGGAIPIAKTLDPTSSQYLHWYFPGLGSVDKNSACDVDPRTYPIGAHALHDLMYGELDGVTIGSTKCGDVNGDGSKAQFTTADFSNWRMVTIRQPKTGEATTRFFDIPTLETASEIVLDTPRVSFFTTPAFFANWSTNTSNEMRVTVNQAFIVATSSQVDGTDPTQPQQTPGLDTTHANQPACVGCHQTLDPSRAIFQATYSYDYGQQTDPKLQAQPGQFTYRGVVSPVSTIYDFGARLAAHPMVAQAWAEKLCFWIDSQACATDDPAFQAIVSQFASDQSWTKLVENIATSSITTNASQSQTAKEEGELVAVSRKYHLCTALGSRLGLGDVCGLDLLKQPSSGIPAIVAGLPSDQYGRGTPVPVLPNAPSMFYRSGLENICSAIAPMVVDPTTSISGAKVYASTSQANVDAAIADFVATLMGIVPSDPRSPQLVAALADHYTSALGTGAKATDALKSTFVVACTTPSVAGIGM